MVSKSTNRAQVAAQEPGAVPDGRALRADWDRRCAATINTLRAVRATVNDDPVVAKYLDRVIRAAQGLHSVAAGRRYTPLDVASGLGYDEPQQLRIERYAEAVAAIDALAHHWHNKLGIPDWNWAEHGYPPGWTSSLIDRLRAGLFYRHH